MQGVGCRVQGVGCRVQSAGCRVQGAEFRGYGCKVQGELIAHSLKSLQHGLLYCALSEWSTHLTSNTKPELQTLPPKPWTLNPMP